MKWKQDSGYGYSIAPGADSCKLDPIRIEIRALKRRLETAQHMERDAFCLLETRLGEATALVPTRSLRQQDRSASGGLGQAGSRTSTKKAAILIPASPTRAFFSQIAAFSLALQEWHPYLRDAMVTLVRSYAQKLVTA